MQVPPHVFCAPRDGYPSGQPGIRLLKFLRRPPRPTSIPLEVSSSACPVGGPFPAWARFGDRSCSSSALRREAVPLPHLELLAARTGSHLVDLFPVAFLKPNFSYGGIPPFYRGIHRSGARVPRLQERSVACPRVPPPKAARKSGYLRTLVAPDGKSPRVARTDSAFNEFPVVMIQPARTPRRPPGIFLGCGSLDRAMHLFSVQLLVSPG